MCLSLRNLFVLAVFAISISGCETKKTRRLKTEVLKVNSPDQIVLVSNKLVKPTLYTNISGLEKLSGRKAKAKFISAILPAILVAKYEIEQRRKKIILLRSKKTWNTADSMFYSDMKNRYRARDTTDLLKRIGTLPTSLVLAQAAIESGWGKSRFFLKANNLFGVWSFNIKEPRIPALKRRNSKLVYLRAYPDLSQSIVHYFEILARAKSYSTLRDNWQQTVNPFELLPHLKYYSERRGIYTNELKRVMLHNNLTQFDLYEIDPAYFLEE